MLTARRGVSLVLRALISGPSGADRAAAVPGQINIVFGARDHKVYFYNNAGGIGKPMKLKDFLGQ